MPKVSVILNCYRQAPYVREAVESVLAQTCQDFELLAIDNGSPDETPNILRQYEKDPRVRLFLHQDNRAISMRFNEGVRAATGEFVSFLYSDDTYLPHKLEKQLALFEGLSADYGVAYAPLMCRNQNTGATWVSPVVAAHGYALPTLLERFQEGFPDMLSPLTRRACFVRHPFLDDVFAEGEGIFLRVALTHKFVYSPDPVAVMRDTGENRGKAIRVNVDMHERTLQTLESDPAFDSVQYARALRRYRARLWRNSSFALSRSESTPTDRAWARSALGKAFRLDPRSTVHYRTLLALGLLALPDATRSRLNALGHRVRGIKRSTTSVSGYGGSSGH